MWSEYTTDSAGGSGTTQSLESRPFLCLVDSERAQYNKLEISPASSIPNQSGVLYHVSKYATISSTISNIKGIFNRLYTVHCVCILISMQEYGEAGVNRPVLRCWFNGCYLSARLHHHPQDVLPFPLFRVTVVEQ